MSQHTKRLIEEAFLLGFMLSREGFNGEYVFDHCCDGLKPYDDSFRAKVEASKAFCEARCRAVSILMAEPDIKGLPPA